MSVHIDWSGPDIRFRFPYDVSAVADLKLSVPSAARRWDQAHKCWLIDRQYAPLVARIAADYFGVSIGAVNQPLVTSVETRLLEVRYLGRCKADTNRASGWVGDGWAVVFPLEALLDWFEFGGMFQTPGPPKPKTLFGVLGLPPTADDLTIVSAYRRMARQWHPDVCKEPDAAERFIAIQRAYDVLHDPKQRRKYEVGLALEASLVASDKPTQSHMASTSPTAEYGYRSPLRCGWVLAEGTTSLGRFVVSKVLSWQDITNTSGQTLVPSWPQGAERFVEEWH